MKRLCYVIGLSAMFVFSLAGCTAESVTNERTDKKLEELRKESAGEELTTEKQVIKSYIISKEELNSINTYETEFRDVLKEFIESNNDDGLKITTGSDSERQTLMMLLFEFQGKIVEDAGVKDCHISLDTYGIEVTAGEDIDISDYINAICVAEGLRQRIDKGYAEWSVEVNVVNNDGERIVQKTVTGSEKY